MTLPKWKGRSQNRYNFVRTINDAAISQVLRLFFQVLPKATVLQIGANDGQTSDPIFAYLKDSDRPALLVEPDPFLFQKLLNLHKPSENVQLLNAAVAPKDFDGVFYAPKHNTKLASESYISLLGSFNWDAIADHIHDIGELDDFFDRLTVKLLTLDDIFQSYQQLNFDLLCIDTEGFDAEVIKSASELPNTIKLIVFEHKFLSPKDYIETLNLLESQNYRLWNLHPNSIAIRDLPEINEISDFLDVLSTSLLNRFAN